MIRVFVSSSFSGLSLQASAKIKGLEEQATKMAELVAKAVGFDDLESP